MFFEGESLNITASEEAKKKIGDQYNSILSNWEKAPVVKSNVSWSEFLQRKLAGAKKFSKGKMAAATLSFMFFVSPFLKSDAMTENQDGLAGMDKQAPVRESNRFVDPLHPGAASDMEQNNFDIDLSERESEEGVEEEDVTEEEKEEQPNSVEVYDTADEGGDDSGTEDTDETESTDEEEEDTNEDTDTVPGPTYNTPDEMDTTDNTEGTEESTEETAEDKSDEETDETKYPADDADTKVFPDKVVKVPGGLHHSEVDVDNDGIGDTLEKFGEYLADDSNHGILSKETPDVDYDVSKFYGNPENAEKLMSDWKTGEKPVTTENNSTPPLTEEPTVPSAPTTSGVQEDIPVATTEDGDGAEGGDDTGGDWWSEYENYELEQDSSSQGSNPKVIESELEMNGGTDDTSTQAPTVIEAELKMNDGSDGKIEGFQSEVIKTNSSNIVEGSLQMPGGTEILPGQENIVEGSLQMPGGVSVPTDVVGSGSNVIQSELTMPGVEQEYKVR
ncbi:hypothetical protein KJ855_03780 [Patescibacteria group bacterium]|nr:hypothetical protein [Patescibacteria group bacterium]